MEDLEPPFFKATRSPVLRGVPCLDAGFDLVVELVHDGRRYVPRQACLVQERLELLALMFQALERFVAVESGG